MKIEILEHEIQRAVQVLHQDIYDAKYHSHLGGKRLLKNFYQLKGLLAAWYYIREDGYTTDMSLATLQAAQALQVDLADLFYSIRDLD